MTLDRPFNIGPFQSDVLNLSRWVAALLVVIEHLRSLLFAEYGDAGRLGPIGKAFYFVTNFGHQAVMVFFAMSGFLVGGKVLDRLLRGNFEWPQYGVDRVSRLYAVYVLALLLGCALDWIGYHHLNELGLYNQIRPSHIALIDHDFSQDLTVPVFWVNLVMCQTILGPVLGSNGPLWSLANEAWYYLAGPLLFVLLFGRKTSSRMVGIIGLAFVVWFLPGSILVYALVWLLGAGLYFINGRVLLPLWVSLVLFGVSFVNARLLWIPNGYITDFLIGISFALVINSAAGGSHRILGHVWSNAAAAFSYSVYLCHCSFLIFVVSWLFHLGWIDPSRSPTPRLAGIFLLVLLAAYVWCYLISLVTERQTSRIRAWLGKHLIQKLGIGV